MFLAVSTGESVFQLVVVFIIFIFILVLTYYSTKWIAGYQKSHTYNNNLEIVETLKLTTNKYVQIVRAGDKYLVLGIGKDEITSLGELSAEEVINPQQNGFEVNAVVGSQGFQDILEKMKSSKIKSKKDEEV